MLTQASASALRVPSVDRHGVPVVLPPLFPENACALLLDVPDAALAIRTGERIGEHGGTVALL